MFRNTFRSFAKTVGANTVRIPFVIGGTAVGVSYVFLNSIATKPEEHQIHNGHAVSVDAKLAEKVDAIKAEFKADEKEALKEDIKEEKEAAEDSVESEIEVAPIQDAPETVEPEQTKEESDSKDAPADETELTPVEVVEVLVEESEDGSETVTVVEEVVEVEADAAPAAAAAAEGESEGETDPSQQAAYNPETGEINWDCPCLGGMADGPCGEEFKESFACFVYSETEPKGIDCIKKFENMRTCFRKYPEHYREELYEDDVADADAPSVESEAPASETPSAESETPAATAA